MVLPIAPRLKRVQRVAVLNTEAIVTQWYYNIL